MYGAGADSKEPSCNSAEQAATEKKENRISPRFQEEGQYLQRSTCNSSRGNKSRLDFSVAV